MSDLAHQVIERFVILKLSISTAESCTGGLVAGALTEIPGSSAVLACGLVTYSNQAKTNLLGVPASLIEAHGAVSEPVARAMAQGALLRGQTDVAVSITGIAGPSGGSAEKPVGTVWFGLALAGSVRAERRHFTGSRHDIRAASVDHALSMLLDLVK